MSLITVCILFFPGLCIFLEETKKIILYQIITLRILLRTFKSRVPEFTGVNSGESKPVSARS